MSFFDIDQVKDMVDAFMEAGFTYFDTAWAYAGSEDAIRQFETSLERTGAMVIDITL